MATLTTVKGKNVALMDTVPMPKLPAGDHYGKLRVLYDSYTVLAADEFGTDGLIKLFKIPKGATLVDFEVDIPATGSTGQFVVGWAASEEKDSDGAAVVTASANGIFTTLDPGDGAVANQRMLTSAAGYMKRFNAEVEVQVDCTEATADAGEKTLRFKATIAVE